MSDDLRILIRTGINEGLSIKEINASIKKLERHPSLQKIKIKIDIDNKIANTLNQFNKNFSEIEKTSKGVSSSLNNTSKEVKDHTKAVEDATSAEVKWRIERQKTSKITGNQTTVRGNDVNNNKQTVIGNTDGSVRDIIDSTNPLKDLKEQEDLINKMADFREKSEIRVREEQRKSAELQQEWIQKNADLERKEQEKIATENEKRDRDYYSRKEKMEVKIADIRRRFGSDDNVQLGLNKLEEKLSRVSKVGDYRREIDNLETGLKRVISTANTAGSSVMNFGEALSTAFQKFPVWMLATTAFYFPLRSLQSGLQNVYELDSALVDLQKVTEGTADTYERFVLEAKAVGDAIGGTTLNIIKSSAEWARLGYSIEQVQQLAKQTLVYQNVGDIKSAEDASKALISAIKGFGIEVDAQGRNVSNVVDIYNEVGNKFAISSAGIGEAMRRSASALKEGGNTIEEAVALATAANSTIQDEARVGNALKSTALRIRGISEEGEDLSNLVPQLEDNFRKLGLTLKKDENTFLSTYEIMKSLSSIWGDITDFQRAETLELVAGKWNANVISSLIQNFSDAQGALEAALNSTGSAAKENEKYLDSMAGRISLFQNQVTSFWNSATNTETLKQIIDLGTSLIGVLESATDTFGSLNIVTLLLATSVLKFSSAGKSLVGTAMSAIPALGEMNTRAERLSAAYQRASKSTSMLGVDLAGLRASMIATRASAIALQTTMTLGLSLAITGIVAGLTALYSKYQEQQKIQKEFEAQQKHIANNFISSKDQINELVESYTKLSEATKNGTLFTNLEQEQEYKDIIEKLSELMPNLVSSIDEKGNKHLKAADAIKQELLYARELAGIEQKQIVLDAESNFDKQIKDIKDLEDQILSLYSSMALGGTILSNGAFLPFTESEINKQQFQIRSLQQQVATSANLMRDDLNNLVKTILDINEVEISDSLSKEIDEIVKGLNVADLDKSELVAKGNVIAKLFTDISSLKTASSVQEAMKLNKEILATGESAGFTEDEIKSFIISLTSASEEADGASSATEEFRKQFEELHTTIGETEAKLTELSSAYQTLAQGEQLSSNTILELIQKYPTLAKHLVETNDLTFNKGELLKEIAEIERQRRIQEVQDAIDSVETTRNELQQKQDLFKQYYDNLAKSGGSIDAWMFNSALTDEEKKKLESANAEMEQLQAKLAILNRPLETSGFSPKSSSSSTKSPAELAAEARQEAYKKDLDLLQYNTDMFNWSTQQQIDGYNKLSSAHKQYLSESVEDQRSINLELKQLNEQLNQDRLTALEKSIDAQSKVYSSFQAEITASERQQLFSEDGSDKYITQTEKQIAIREKWQAQLHKDNNVLREQRSQLKESDPLFSALTEQINANSDSWWELEEAILGSTKSLQTFNATQFKDTISSIISTLKESLSADEIFNEGEFSDSIDSIISELDKLDGKFESNTSFTTSTKEARDNLTVLASEIRDIASDVEKFANSSSSNVSQMGNVIKSQLSLADNLKTKLSEVSNTIRDLTLQYEREEQSLQNNIDNIERYYDIQIEAQREKLKLLDEEYEKEDRVAKLKELNDELDKTKADKRFSYITEAGEEILTYDKARVNELEKQKDELVKQYEREDVRKAIESEIERLENSKESTIRILQEQLEKTKQIHAQELESLRLYQGQLSSLYQTLNNDIQEKLTEYETALVTGFENGTISAEKGTRSLQGVINGWMGSSLASWDSHITSVSSKLAALQAMYASMNGLSASPRVPSSGAIGKAGKAPTKKYHTGGTAGEEPLRQDEVPAILRLGESVFTEEHMKRLKEVIIKPIDFMSGILQNIKAPSMPTISRNSPASSSTHYSLSDFTIVANNPMELFEGIQRHINSNKR